MVLVIVAQDRQSLNGLSDCFELRKIRPINLLPDTPAARQVYLQQQLLKKSWVLSKRLKCKMPELPARPQRNKRVAGKRQTSPARSSQDSSHDSDDEAHGLIAALEKKRKQLDDQIAKYIAERSEEYKQFETELRCREGQVTLISSRSGNHSDQIQSGDKRANHVSHVDAPQFRDKAPRHSVHETVAGQDGHHDAASGTSSAQSSTDGTPAHDREKELRGFFTPSYLPLLDSRNYRPDAPRRTKSAPELSSDAGDGNDIKPTSPSTAALGAEGLIRNTASSSPPPARVLPLNSPNTLSSRFVENQQPNSALKHPRKSSRRKKVSFNIDNKIHTPADIIEEQTLPPAQAVKFLPSSTPLHTPLRSPPSQGSSEKPPTATKPTHLIVPDTRQEAQTESQLHPDFLHESLDSSSEASPGRANGEQEIQSAVMSKRNLSDAMTPNKSKQLSSIYEDEDLMFGLDGDATPAQAPGGSVGAVSPADRSSPPAVPGVVSPSPTAQSGTPGPSGHVSSMPENGHASSASPRNAPGLPRVADTNEPDQRPQPLSVSQTAGSSSSPESVSPPLTVPRSRHRRQSSTWTPALVMSPPRAVLSPSNPNFTNIVRNDPNFTSFVGGVRGGTGIDPSDRSSFGYPPSLGESYMERNYRRNSDNGEGTSSNGGTPRRRRESQAERDRKEADRKYRIDERSNSDE